MEYVGYPRREVRAQTRCFPQAPASHAEKGGAVSPNSKRENSATSTALHPALIRGALRLRPRGPEPLDSRGCVRGCGASKQTRTRRGPGAKPQNTRPGSAQVRAQRLHLAANVPGAYGAPAPPSTRVSRTRVRVHAQARMHRRRRIHDLHCAYSTQYLSVITYHAVHSIEGLHCIRSRRCVHARVNRMGSSRLVSSGRPGFCPAWPASI